MGKTLDGVRPRIRREGVDRTIDDAVATIAKNLDELQRGATIVVPLAEGLEEAVERASKVLANVKTHEGQSSEFDETPYVT